MRIANLAKRYRHEEFCERARNQRGIEIARSLVLLVTGALALVFSSLTGTISVYFLGGLCLALFAVQVVRIATGNRKLRNAAIAILLGLGAYFLLVIPATGALILAFLIVLVLLSDGFMRLFAALPDPDHPRRREFILTGSVTFAIGVILSLNLEPLARTLIGAVVGLALVIEGLKVLRAVWETRHGAGEAS